MKYWFIFHDSDLLLERRADGTFAVPLSLRPPVTLDADTVLHTIQPFDDGTEVVAAAVEKTLPETPPFSMHGLRQTYSLIPSEHYLKAGKCREILYWDRQTRYCGVCGAPMTMHTDISKVCTRCGKEVWPLLATAVIVLVFRGDSVLLVKARNFRGDYYGLVAGFVETGETLEQAVHREVMEETGITIKNVTYCKSQPWPYPCGLMAGFYAEYVSGDIRIQESELLDAAWFTKDSMPPIPEKLSIARQLIDRWREGDVRLPEDKTTTTGGG